MSDSAKIPATVIVPVLNEEAHLSKCLSTLGAFERVVVVDSGSTDSTASICATYEADIVQFVWNGSFPKKRNWALRNLTIVTPWILFLDADEEVTAEFVEALPRYLANPNYAAYWVQYTNSFNGRTLRYGVPQRKIALLRAGAGEFEQIDEDRWSRCDMEVHEHPIVSGDVGCVSERIKHNDFRGLSHFITKHNEYSDWEAHRFLSISRGTKREFTRRQRWKYKFVSHPLVGILYFIYSYFLRAGFLDGSPGLHYAILKGVYFYQVSLKVNELRRLSEIGE